MPPSLLRSHASVFPCSGRQVLLPTFLLAGVLSAHAGLTWPQKTVEAKGDAQTTVVEVRFPFKNNGTTPVDITQVQSSCGCTTVALEKRHYAPGEGGEIVAQYTAGEHTGLQKKNVLVATNDGAEPVELTLAVQIPEVLRITPSFVTWKHNEAPTPKVVTVEMEQDSPLKDIDLQSSSAAVTAELKAITKGRKYQITVTPSQTDQNVFSTLTMRCKFGDTERVFRTYATVQPPAPE